MQAEEMRQARIDLVTSRLMPDKILTTVIDVDGEKAVVRRWLGVCDSNLNKNHPCHVCRCNVDYKEFKGLHGDIHSGDSDVQAFALALHRAKEIVRRFKNRR